MLMRACSVVKAKDVLRGVVVQLDVTVYVSALIQEKAPAPSRSPQNETGTHKLEDAHEATRRKLALQDTAPNSQTSDNSHALCNCQRTTAHTHCPKPRLLTVYISRSARDIALTRASSTAT